MSTLETLVILLEDRRFFKHRGVDWKSIAREIWKMITLQKFGGASTLDMQFVRTQTGYKSRKLSRKLYEIFLAIMIQRKMSKIGILRSYLGVVYMGSGLTGVSAAAEKVFQKEPSELTRHEAAFIAAMMVYPRPLRPDKRWKEKVNRRANYGLILLANHSRSGINEFNGIFGGD